MTVAYDPLLIALSVLIAVFGAFTGLQLARRLPAVGGVRRKALLAAAAVAIGGGIWSMHFVGMLALHLPVTVNYDVLLTLVSALVSVLVTGIALIIASYGPLTAPRLAASGLLMGLGISTMHYVGMAAVRANCVIAYDGGLVAASVAVGIGASLLALWLAFNPRGGWQTIAAAAVMGLAISGMHYTAMAAASFLPIEVMEPLAAPAISQYLLAIVVAIATFLILGFTLLVSLPDVPQAMVGTEPAADEPMPQHETPPQLLKVPVEKNKSTVFLDPETIVSIQAEAHYTRIFDGCETYFCSWSVSELESRLDPNRFLRVHRSHIVNIRHAKSFQKRRQEGVIRLDVAESREIPVSRANVPRLRAALGL